MRASLQGERDGVFSLGWCYQHGEGCERDVIKAKENYRLAAKFSHVQAMIRYGLFLNESDPQRWHWLGQAAKRGFPFSFFNAFSKPVNRFKSDPSLASVVFMIGRYLRGHIDMEKREIFGETEDFVFDACDSRIGPANRAIDFFTAQCAAARKAVDTWCLIACRLNSKVNRDIRKKIGLLVWDARELAD